VDDRAAAPHVISVASLIPALLLSRPMEIAMNEELKDHVTNTNVWMRLLFMALFGVVYAVSRFVLLAVVVAQFLWLLFTGSTNERLLSFGGQLATFVYQILRYLTFNTDARPYPFADWPDNTALIPEVVEEAAADEAWDDASEESAEEAVIVEAESETGIEAEEENSNKDKS
jgi:hypothetical protein